MWSVGDVGDVIFYKFWMVLQEQNCLLLGALLAPMVVIMMLLDESILG
jgi:hypothetical protein